MGDLILLSSIDGCSSLPLEVQRRSIIYSHSVTVWFFRNRELFPLKTSIVGGQAAMFGNLGGRTVSHHSKHIERASIVQEPCESIEGLARLLGSRARLSQLCLTRSNGKSFYGSTQRHSSRWTAIAKLDSYRGYRICPRCASVVRH